MRLLSDLLPTDVRVFETNEDFGQLVHEEEEYFRTASAKRLREVTTARACARELLAPLGLRHYPLVPGDDGAPRWPGGLVGSLTHCRGFRAAAVASKAAYASIGIDVEPAVPLSEAALEAVVNAADCSAVRHALWSVILFSAKEASFKAWNSAGVAGVHALDISISLEVSGTFHASPPPSTTRVPQISGLWSNRHQHVATAALIKAERIEM